LSARVADLARVVDEVGELDVAETDNSGVAKLRLMAMTVLEARRHVYVCLARLAISQ
jgi:hypothetical protein